MKLWTILIISVIGCSTEKNNDLKQNIFVSAVKSAKVTVTGKVAKGKISQARVDAYRLNADGTCNTGAGNLASALTDSSGDYTLTYARTGLPICVIAVPNGSSRMYDEGTDTEIDWTGSASLTMIMREPSGSSKTGMNLTPFSRIIASRLAAIAKNNKSTSILDKQVTYANKATAVIFGFTKGFTKSLRSDSTVMIWTRSKMCLIPESISMRVLIPNQNMRIHFWEQCQLLPAKQKRVPRSVPMMWKNM